MSEYHWGLMDAESQLNMYRKAEYRRRELETEIAHKQVDAQVRQEQLTKLNSEVTAALKHLNKIRQQTAEPKPKEVKK